MRAAQTYTGEGRREGASVQASSIAAPLVPGSCQESDTSALPRLVEFRHGRWWDGFYLLWVILRFIIVAEWVARARETYGAIIGRGADQMASRG